MGTFFGSPGDYHLIGHHSRPLTDADNTKIKSLEQIEYDKQVKQAQNRAAYRARRGLEPLAETKKIEPVPPQPPVTHSRVFFCVHKSLGDKSWSIEWHNDENEYLSATLHIKTKIGLISIHSVHNPNTKEQKIEIEPLANRLREPQFHIVLGDFNLHDESWGGELFKQRQATPKARDLRVSMHAAGLELVTKKGTITYTRGLQNDSEHDRNVRHAPSSRLTGTADSSMAPTDDSTIPTNNTTMTTSATSVSDGGPVTSTMGRTRTGWVGEIASCIDLTFVSKELQNRVKSWSVDQNSPVEKSDHRCIRTVLDVGIFLDKTRYYNFREAAKGSYQVFVGKEMQRLEKWKLESKEDLDKAIEELVKVMIEARDKFVPSRLAHPPSKRKNKKPPDAGIKTSAQSQAANGGPQAPQQSAQQEYQLAKDAEFANYRENVAKKSQSPNGVFDLAKMAARSARPKVVDNVPTLDQDTDGMVYESPEEQQACFRTTLWSDTSDEAPPRLELPILPPDRQPFEIEASVSESQVKEAIKKIKIGKASGNDKVSTNSIKLASEQITPFLVRLFQACMDLCLVPDAFKDAITVILRKPDKDTYSSPKSWRPIALLSVIGKLYERILTDIMVAAAIKYNLLPDNQYGAPGGSTTKAIKAMLKVVYKAWSTKRNYVTKNNKRKLVHTKLPKATLLCLDMTAAFDCVPRAQLLQELADKGYPEWFLRIIHSFLSDRKTSLKLPRSSSEKFHVNIGIPQGSPLSPILFLFFAAPLLKVIKDHSFGKVTIHTLAYVDDTYLIAVSDSYEENCKALAEAHKGIMAWSAKTGIKFSPKKYNLMHFKCPDDPSTTPTNLPDIPGLKNNTACLKDKVKVLGVIVDSQLKWDHHVTEIELKVNRALHRRLQRISGPTWGAGLEGCIRFFNGTIRPMLSYACSVWFIHSPGEKLKWALRKKLRTRLKQLQKKCIKAISGAFGNFSLQMVENELHFEDVLIFLYRRMISERATSLKISPFTHYAVETVGEQPKFEARTLTPYEILDKEAAVLCTRAGKLIKSRDESKSKSKSNGKDKDPYDGKKVWQNPRRRKAVIKRLAQQDADERSIASWEEFCRKRAKRPHRPMALEGTWHRNSLKIYRGLNRAQSTMLLQCRTEYIGLNSYLHSIQATRSPVPSEASKKTPQETPKEALKEVPQEVVPTECSCGHPQQTVFHMFLDCPDLNDARSQLKKKLLFLNIKRLLTRQGRFAADWAISYFKLDQFKNVTDKSTFASKPTGD
ncbi:hypothetical protein NXS19_011038 [Fusarium pseudograminearum]|nr:hypothetical protein NXS19_011038 [Fusarium pseudograminearum]